MGETMRILLAPLATVIFLIAALTTQYLHGQVFGLGVSDPALFANGSFNLPTDSPPFTSGDLQQINVTDGGDLRFGFDAFSGSEVNISGGNVGDFFNANDGSEINISGGVVGAGFDAFSGSFVNISGGNIGEGFGNLGGVVYFSGGVIGDFAHTFGGETNISGGSLGNGFQFVGETVNISGGSIGNDFFALSGEINISGGTVGNDFVSNPAATINISGGTIGDGFGSSGEVNISGGNIGQNFSAGGETNITGGLLGAGFTATDGSVVNLFGSEFTFDGEIIPGLLAGDTLNFTERGGTLAGILADGSPFDIDIDLVFDAGQFFDPGSTFNLTVVSVPEPSALTILALGAPALIFRRRR